MRPESEKYLGKTVRVKIDRPLDSKYPDQTKRGLGLFLLWKYALKQTSDTIKIRKIGDILKPYLKDSEIPNF